MFGRAACCEKCLSIEILPWILRGNLPKCQHFFLLIGPFPKTLIYIREALSKYFYFIRKFSKLTR
jgi:hypothetical protein